MTILRCLIFCIMLLAVGGCDKEEFHPNQRQVPDASNLRTQDQECVNAFIGTWNVAITNGGCADHTMTIADLGQCNQVRINNVCNTGESLIVEVTCPACIIDVRFSDSNGCLYQLIMQPSANQMLWSCNLIFAGSQCTATALCEGTATR